MILCQGEINASYANLYVLYITIAVSFDSIHPLLNQFTQSVSASAGACFGYNNRCELMTSGQFEGNIVFSGNILFVTV